LAEVKAKAADVALSATEKLLKNNLKATDHSKLIKDSRDFSLRIKLNTSSKKFISKLMSKLEELYKLFKSGDIDASLNSVEEILSNAPNNPDALHLGAMIFNAKGEIQNAHNYITKALQLSPQNYEMFNTLGNVFFQSKDIRRARISYQTAIDLNVSYEAALKNLASLEIEDSRPFVALDILKDAKKLSPQNTLYDYMIIRCLRQSEQIEAAYSYLEDMEVST